MADQEMQPRPNDNLDGTTFNSLKGRQNESNLPLADAPFFGQSVKSGFHQSTRTCYQKLRNAALHHEWHKAAQYMTSFFQTIEDTHVACVPEHMEMIWKAGIDILHHLPTTRMEHYNNFYEQMKLLGHKNYILVNLEHAFHLMANGQIDKAKHQLSMAETWRYGTLSEGQIREVKLVQAYQSLLDYFTWCDKRTNFSKWAALSTDEMAKLDMETVYKKSAVNLKEILKYPGVWDPFILCYVDMLDHYHQQQEEVSTVLEDYAHNESFPPNPNAHVYLYRHLKKSGAKEKKLRHALKTLHGLVPSHELMPEYVSLLLKSDKDNDIRKALDVSLEMLDFACWKRNLVAWKSLKAAIKKLKTLHADRWRDAVGDGVASRRDWWPAFHFTHFHAEDDRAASPALLRVKAWACRLLFPGNGYILEWQTFKAKSTELGPRHEETPSPKETPSPRKTPTEPLKRANKLSRSRRRIT